MRRDRIHNALSAIFLLMVFAAPLAVKNLHHHANSLTINYVTASQKFFSEPVKPCLICSFVPINPISKSSENFVFYPVMIDILIAPEYPSPSLARPEYFLLRAPPVCVESLL